MLRRELRLVTEAVSLGAAAAAGLWPLLVVDGAGLADELASRAASHAAEPTMITLCL